MPHLSAIYLSPSPRSPMISADTALLLPNGLEGDRYAANAGTFSRFPDPEARPISLMSVEDLESLAADGYDLSDGRHRRNLVLAGLDFPALLNRVLQIGPTARIRVTRPCSTCIHLERLADLPGCAASLKGRAGLRAAVVTPGPLRVGDPVIIDAG